MKHLSLESQTRMRENEAAYAEVRALLAHDPAALSRQIVRDIAAWVRHCQFQAFPPDQAPHFQYRCGLDAGGRWLGSDGRPLAGGR